MSTSTAAAESSVADGLVAAVAGVWRAIQQHHSEVDDVVLAIGEGGSADQRRLGHFTSRRRAVLQDNGAHADQLLVDDAVLTLGPAAVLGALLHDAAHALAQVRGVIDTSREGRYHNRRFVALAEELGLEVAESATRGWGWADTRVSEATARLYAQQLAELDSALAAHPVAPAPAKQAGEGRSRLLPATCACTPVRRIRVTKTVLDLGEITCQLCGSAFTSTE